MPEVLSQNGAITKREKKEKISCCGCLTSGCEHLASAAKPGKGGFLVLLQFLTLAHFGIRGVLQIERTALYGT